MTIVLIGAGIWLLSSIIIGLIVGRLLRELRYDPKEDR